MLTSAELAQAEELLVKLREVTRLAAPEFVRDGQELGDLLRCSRSHAWMLTHRPDFPKAVRLGEKLKLRR